MTDAFEVRSTTVFDGSDEARAVDQNPEIGDAIIRKGARQVRSITRGGDWVVLGGGAHRAAVLELGAEGSRRLPEMRGQWVQGLDATADGRVLLYSTKNDLIVASLTSGERIASLPAGTDHSGGLLVEGRPLAVSAPLLSGGLHGWDLESGAKLVHGEVQQPVHMHALGPSTLVTGIMRFGASGRELSAVEAWDTSTFEPKWRVSVGPVEEPVELTCLDVGRDGRLVAFGTAQGELVVVRDGEPFQILPLTGKRVKQLHFRRSVPGDELLVLDDRWTLRCFDLGDPASPVERFVHTLESHGCAGSTWSSEGRPVIAADRVAFMDREPVVYVADAVSGEELGSFPSPDSQHLALWDDGWLVSGATSGRVDVVRLPGVPEQVWADPVLTEMKRPIG